MGEPYVSTTCVHYRGLAAPCRADVDVRELVDEDQRVPCITIRDITGTKPCALRLVPLVAPAGEAGPMTKMLSAILADRCPKCNGPINGEMEFNGAILALPCRHVLRTDKDF